MKSRYDYMKASKVLDEISGDTYPDPISFNYLSFKVSSIPDTVYLNDYDAAFLWEISSRFYGSPELEDLVLTLNGVSHRNFLNSGDRLLFPKIADINNSFTVIDNPL